jgi:hypothetical protein
MSPPQKCFPRDVVRAQIRATVTRCESVAAEPEEAVIVKFTDGCKVS